MKKLTRKDFINRSNNKYNYKYDYSKVSKFDNNKTKIIIICPTHGEFKQPIRVHLSSEHGCPKCARFGASKKQKFKTSDLIVLFNNKHNYKYDYSKVEHENIYKKIIIICLKHGEFLQSPKNHLSGRGCPKCDIENRTMKLEEFIVFANKIHNNKYDYSKINKIINNRNKITIICSEHGDFSQILCDHLRGCGCPKCHNIISKLEILWLDSLNIPQENRHKTIIINKKRYNFDAYDSKSNTIYEFYGDYWHGNPKVFKADDINKTVYKKFGELYNNTIKREAELISFGYNLITIWENDFKNI